MNKFKDKWPKVISNDCSNIALFILVLITFIFLSIEGCAKMKDHVYMGNISFSPDGKRLLFDYGKGDDDRMITIYDLEKESLNAYKPPKNEVWAMAKYSKDGKNIVFLSIPVIDGKQNLRNAQITIMDIDGTNMKKITRTSDLKLYPSFSHSGEKVIFCKADIREKGRTPVAGFDVYEVDINSGIESRLTWFKFFSMGQPKYLPGDRQFMVAAEYPSQNPGMTEEERSTNQKIENLSRSKYHGQLLYIMERNQRVLKPYVEDYSFSMHPSMTADGKQIFFLGIGNPQTNGDWYRYYKYNPNGKHQSVAHLKTTVYSADVSPYGHYLVIVCGENNGRHLVIYDIADGRSKEIKLSNISVNILNNE